MKYRLVARFTSSKVIAQIVYATLTGDRVLCQANSTELSRWGLTAGLTNYSSAYCTGLLLARRLLSQLKMDKLYAGKDKIDGEDYCVGEEPNPERRPFKAVLDIGLVRTTTGNKVFGVLKGAVDGGLYVPHGSSRFPGNVTEGETKEYNTEKHRERIFGEHVDEYMASLKEEGEQEYKDQFSQWDKCLKTNKVSSVKALYEKVHAGIMKDPAFKKKAVKANPDRKHSQFRKPKVGRKVRKERANKKIQLALEN